MLLSLSSFHFATSPQGLGAELGDFRVKQPWEEEEKENKKGKEKVWVWGGGGAVGGHAGDLQLTCHPL